MRAYSVFVALFAAGSLAAPMLPKLLERAVTTKEVVDVVAMTITAGSSPSSPSALPIATSPDLSKHLHAHGHAHHFTHVSIPIKTQSYPVVSSTSLAAAPPRFTGSPVDTSVASSAPTPTSPIVETPTTAKSAPKPISTPSDGSPLSGGISYLTTINKWRSAYNLQTLSWSSQLEANAQKTGTDDGGVNEKHELNPGSMAQVITPGQQVATQSLNGDSPFELAYVAWLCEVPTDPELSDGGVDQCALVKTVLNMVYTDTGHHDILTSKAYSKIGCFFAPNPAENSKSEYQGLYVCDLA